MRQELAADMIRQMDKLGREATFDRDLFFLQLARPGEIPKRLELPSPNFACLLVWDAAGESPDTISKVVTSLVDSGCSYFCAWGSSCELVHDIFDEVEVGDGLDYDEAACAVTTWHADDSLDGVLNYFQTHTDPVDRLRKTTKAAIAIVIGDDPQRAEQVRSGLAQ